MNAAGTVRGSRAADGPTDILKPVLTVTPAMFPRVEYIHWMEGRPEQARYDLATSDLRMADSDAGQVVPDALVGLSDPDEEVTLESQIADAYDVSESEVLVTAGATHAYVLAVAAALTGEDDRVLVEMPGYEPLRRTPEAFGATVDRFRRQEDDDYRLDPGRVEAAVVEDTALAVLTNRHNPSGRLADRETMEAAAAAARDSDAPLLVDEVYAPYTTSPTGGAFGGPTVAGVDGAAVTGSLTKFHGLGGLCIGWIIADEPFLDAAREVCTYLPVRAEPSVALARRALANADDIAAGARERLRANNEHLAAFVADRDDVNGPVGDGSPFAFLEHASADGDAVVDAARGRDLLVVPGRFFEDVGRFRVSLGGDPGAMEAALDVLAEVLDGL
jgi:aspartate/methionine/tyrosine aminotransferase